MRTHVAQAQKRGVKYEILPPGMQRRKLNTSRYDRRTRTIFWHIHWQFPAADESVHDHRVSEQSPLKQLLQQHVSLVPGNSLKRHALRRYVEAGLHNLVLLMKKEHCPVRLHLLHCFLCWHAVAALLYSMLLLACCVSCCHAARLLFFMLSYCCSICCVSCCHPNAAGDPNYTLPMLLPELP